MKSYHPPAPTASSLPEDLRVAEQIRRLEHNQFADDHNSPVGAALGQLKVNIERLGRDKPVPGSAWVLLAKQIVAAGGVRR